METHLSRRMFLFLSGLILVFALYLRWINYPDVLFFGFEQGRDAIIAHQILDEKAIKLVGPKTDLAGIFHGVWWYYGLALLYGLGAGSPIFVIFSLILLQVGTIVVLGRTILEFINSRIYALGGMLFLAISHEHILFARWLSNVGPAYFFFPLGILFLFRFFQKAQTKDLVLSAIFAGLAVQFQIALLFPMIAFSILLLITRTLRVTFKQLILALLGVSVWFIPIFLFNLRHDFQSIFAIRSFIFEPEPGTASRTFLESSTTWALGFLSLFIDAVGVTAAVAMFILFTVLVGLKLKKVYLCYLFFLNKKFDR